MTAQNTIATVPVQMRVEDWEMVRHIIVTQLGAEQRNAEPEDRAEIRAASRRVWDAITSVIGEPRH